MLEKWFQCITESSARKVFVFCSAGQGTDPLVRGRDGRAVDCQSFRLVNEARWQQIPDKIRVPHTFKKQTNHPSAFVVNNIFYPVHSADLPSVEWLKKDGTWREGYGEGERFRLGIPTRGEYLVRRGGQKPIGHVRAVLELKAP